MSLFTSATLNNRIIEDVILTLFDSFGFIFYMVDGILSFLLM